MKYYTSKEFHGDLNIPIYEFWHSHTTQRYDKVVMNYCGNKITNKYMDEKIQKVASALSSIGVKRGEVITICAINIPEVAYLLFAANVIGAIVDLFDPRTNEECVRKYINTSKSKYMFVLDDLIGLTEYVKGTSISVIVHISPYDSLSNGMKLLTNVKRKRIKCNSVDMSFMTWKEFIGNGNNNISMHKSTDYCNEVVAIVHTGGTTGVPKGVKLTNGNLIAEFYNYLALDFDFQKGDKYLNILVPWVAYGLVFCFFVVFCLGFESVLVPLFDTKMITKLILKHKPAQILGIPAYYEPLLHDKKLNGKDLSFIKCLGLGGDSMSAEKEKEFNDFLKEHNSDTKIVKGYGMTELSSSACTCIKSVNKIGSVGIPLINNTISIFDPDTMEEKRYGESGEVCICSPTMMKGYDSEENNVIMKKHSDGKIWIHSGDIGYMDEDGCLFIVDRIKRMIIRKGFKVYPSEIEKVILKIPQVDFCVVVGKKHITDVHTPYIFVVLKEKTTNIEKEAFSRLYKELPEYEIPYASDIQIIDKIPYTKLGKVDFRTLEEMANNTL